MILEKLKEAVNTLEKYRKCGYTDCLGAADLDNSIDVAITVMNDVIKNMEKLINRQG